ncbi:flavodoxin family protein [Tissierella praeacuta]|uniref:flavodoxin family protein n=1 Tax=Tissierella praeacuta TaxID=43131 RepID=UPI0028A9E679|nr:flavodoxin family protein [Tissierella praeacuta]
MNIVSFLGSPRKNGNTSVLLDKVVDGILSKNDAKSETVFLQNKNIKPCMGCNSCKNNEDRVCVIYDDMKDIMTKIKESELIILATPIYWWSVTAQMKLLIDRLYALNFTDSGFDFHNKKVMLLMTYEGELPNSGPETVEKLFKEVCEYLNVAMAGVLGVCTGEVEVSKNSEALERAYEFGERVEFY